MDLSCPLTIRSEICQECRETIRLGLNLFQIWIFFGCFMLSLKIWVNPWSLEQIFAVFCFFPRDGVRRILNYRIIQTTPEYTIPENLVRISRVVSENEQWIKNKK